MELSLFFSCQEIRTRKNKYHPFIIINQTSKTVNKKNKIIQNELNQL
jgi:hypothetical protein